MNKDNDMPNIISLIHDEIDKSTPGPGVTDMLAKERNEGHSAGVRGFFGSEKKGKGKGDGARSESESRYSSKENEDEGKEVTKE